MKYILVDKKDKVTENYLNILEITSNENEPEYQLEYLDSNFISKHKETFDTVEKCIEDFIVFKNNKKLKFLKPISKTVNDKDAHIEKVFLEYEEQFYK